MKKNLLRVSLLTLALLISCNEDNYELEEQQVNIDMSDFYLYTESEDNGSTSRQSNKGKNCSTMEVLNRQLKENPGLYQKMFKIEENSRKFMISAKSKKGNGNGGNGGNDGSGGTPTDDGLGTLNIPVYIYVIYSNNSQNISDQQITSQMNVLNADFNDTNFSDVSSEFSALGADVDINFLDPVIDRRSNPTSNWGLNDAVKAQYPAVPGYLTIWVAPITPGYLGYAQFPGGNSSTDGVVIAPQYFGTTGTAQAPFNGGRTATHEVGHWMNLRHIWGDGRCRQDDFVADTPSSDRPNYGCTPANNCRTKDMIENYMDYTDDSCMGLFTLGQKVRMRSVFAPGGPRASLVGN